MSDNKEVKWGPFIIKSKVPYFNIHITWFKSCVFIFKYPFG